MRGWPPEWLKFGPANLKTEADRERVCARERGSARESGSACTREREPAREQVRDWVEARDSEGQNPDTRGGRLAIGLPVEPLGGGPATWGRFLRCSKVIK